MMKVARTWGLLHGSSKKRKILVSQNSSDRMDTGYSQGFCDHAKPMQKRTRPEVRRQYPIQSNFRTPNISELLLKDRDTCKAYLFKFFMCFQAVLQFSTRWIIE